MDLQEASILAKKLMHQHNLDNWYFEFDRAKRRFGCCHHMKRKITLSAYMTLLNNESEIKDTILHEIAHALCPPKEGHGRVWKQTAQSIGCNATRCCSSEVKEADRRYEYRCPHCNRIIKRHKRTFSKIACGECCRKYNHGTFSKTFILEMVSAK